MLLPLAGQQNWPRDQAAVKGLPGPGGGQPGRQCLELGLARLPGISPEGIKGKWGQCLGGGYNKERGVFPIQEF